MLDEPLIVLVNGLPGSGKTTVAAGLGRRLARAAVLEGDHLQHGLIVRGGVDVGDEPQAEGLRQLTLRWRNLAALAANFADEGFTVIVDSLLIPSLLRTFVSSIAPRPLAYLHLEPEQRVRLERDSKRPSKHIGNRYDDIAAQFESFANLGVWIDSTHQSPEQTIDEAWKSLRSGAASRHRRATSRVLPIDAHGRVLLMQGVVPGRPDYRFWFSIGGARERGETSRAAAVRELSEECGIVVDEGELSLFASEPVEFSYGGFNVVQQQDFFTLVLPQAPQPVLEGMETDERATIVGAAWVPVAEIGRSVHVDNPRLGPLCAQAARFFTG